jgi:hypothetical protein
LEAGEMTPGSIDMMEEPVIEFGGGPAGLIARLLRQRAVRFAIVGGCGIPLDVRV